MYSLLCQTLFSTFTLLKYLPSTIHNISTSTICTTLFWSWLTLRMLLQSKNLLIHYASTTHTSQLILTHWRSQLRCYSVKIHMFNLFGCHPNCIPYFNNLTIHYMGLYGRRCWIDIVIYKSQKQQHCFTVKYIVIFIGTIARYPR